MMRVRTGSLLSTVGLCLSFGAAPAVLAAGDPIASPGCGKPAKLEPGTSQTFAMQVGQLERQYRVHLPPAYDGRRPMSLVLDFHGYAGDAPSEETYTGLNSHADRNGYVVVYPQGTGFEVDGRLVTSWNDLAGSFSSGPLGPICSETAFDYPPPPECGDPGPCTWATCHDDLTFIGEMLDRLENELCVDLDRIYATGMSNGGMFVHRLGCVFADRFAAIAPVGGTLARGFQCAPPTETPLSLMNIWGNRDHYVSQERPESTDGYYYTSARDVLDQWASVSSQNCASERTPYPTGQDGKQGLSCVQHADCATGAEVVHCTWDGEHDWPQAGEDTFGNELIWSFFSRHSRTGYSSPPARDR